MYNNTQNDLPMCDDHGDYCPQDCPERKAHERARADVLNRAEIEERERGMNLAALEDIFERLGIDKKREELEPVMEEARLWIRQGSMPSSDRRILRKLVEFIECLDEP